MNKVAVVPKTMHQRRSIVIRPTVEPLKGERLARIVQIIRRPANWRFYQQAQANNGNSRANSNSKVPVTLIEDAVSKDIEERLEREAGFQSSPKIRRAVELQAMQLVAIKFQKMGYVVSNRSSNNPYDLRCQCKKDVKFVEVKGTQNTGASVVLTNGEVKFIEKNKPNCTICVVHGITIDRTINPKASGGQIRVYECAGLDLKKLRPISFTLKLPV